jgi:hypothetical protein
MTFFDLVLPSSAFLAFGTRFRRLSDYFPWSQTHDTRAMLHHPCANTTFLAAIELRGLSTASFRTKICIERQPLNLSEILN